MSQPPSLDPTSVLVVLSAGFFSREVASVVAPYAVIILASLTGAAWALGRVEPAKRGNSFAFFARLIGTATLITVSAASISHSYLGVEDPQLLFAPIALLIGGIGDDWPKVGGWFVGLIGRTIELIATKKGGG